MNCDNFCSLFHTPYSLFPVPCSLFPLVYFTHLTLFYQEFIQKLNLTSKLYKRDRIHRTERLINNREFTDKTALYSLISRTNKCESGKSLNEI
ncbi:MAG: hypothetical protein F6J98_11000 [Moorea sp. SIO4G2]|uniref:hypothetical protein n=1 Tax=unclassified Moorena TaxID=2683338 RepID=UPI0013F6F30A|nr:MULTISPECIES: hypothetical protein [unclassified Moorena]NEO17693.1 hypothetical protein [Moorena sp. SIO3E8]NEO60934.1 hypothetical protein [Moorena sp. SIO4G2]NEQ04246.1 hypothetical protein [Moorena sp. SIO3F7]